MLDLAALDRIDRALGTAPCPAPVQGAPKARPQATRQGCPFHAAEAAA